MTHTPTYYTQADLDAAVGAALERAAIACTDATWKHEGDDAYSRGMDQGAREQAKASAEAIRAVAEVRKPTTDLLATRARLFEGIALHMLNRGSKEGWCVSIKALHRETGLEQDLLRGALRAMRGVGLVEFYRGLMTEDGMPAGAGYSLTPAGVAYAKANEPKIVPGAKRALRCKCWTEGRGE